MPESRPLASEWLANGAVLLRGFAVELGEALLAHIGSISEVAPFRYLLMPNGQTMSIAMTNCGTVGWVRTASGYGYASNDPLTGHAWPPMPDVFRELAVQAARRAGFEGFMPAVCIINRYAAGASLHMHRDRDDTKDGQPVVSVSLGLPAIFRFGGQGRAGSVRQLRLVHGDTVIWGGPSRMAYHGVLPLEAGQHPLTGMQRFNLTFRSAKMPGRQSGAQRRPRATAGRSAELR
ncbi:DNA oxidative demethylase AlkB [Frateuria aurantia]